MNPRHAAELALMAWYLILPPTLGRSLALTYEPLSEWRVIDKFNSKTECEQIRSKLIDRLPDTAIDTTRCVPDTDLTPEQKIPKVVGYAPALNSRRSL
jgi:hypothetical protein